MHIFQQLDKCRLDIVLSLFKLYRKCLLWILNKDLSYKLLLVISNRKLYILHHLEILVILLKILLMLNISSKKIDLLLLVVLLLRRRKTKNTINLSFKHNINQLPYLNLNLNLPSTLISRNKIHSFHWHL